MIYLSLIKAFLTSKVGQYVLLLILGISLCFFAYKHIYTKGFNQAVSEMKIEEQKAISKALSEQSKRMVLEKEDAVKLATDLQKINTVYVDRVQTITKIINNSAVLSNPVCVMQQNEVEDINKLLVKP